MCFVIQGLWVQWALLNKSCWSGFNCKVIDWALVSQHVLPVNHMTDVFHLLYDSLTGKLANLDSSSAFLVK